MKKSYSEARKMLIDACKGYVKHNQSEMNGGLRVTIKSPYEPASIFFENVFRSLDKCRPDPCFKDWIQCYYYLLLRYTLQSFGLDPYPYKYYSDNYEFPKIKWWFERDAHIDHTAPAIVLYNLQAVINLLDFHLERHLPYLPYFSEDTNLNLEHDHLFNFYQNRNWSYSENKDAKFEQYNLGVFADAPVSVQIYKTFEDLRARAHYAKSYRGKKLQNKYLTKLSDNIDEAIPVFEGYLKGIAVQELEATLERSDLTDKQAIQQLEAQLNNGITIELLMKNRQSQREKDLKLLSVISICIGIGIFTTLGLVLKRLYDSHGRSINFFKPLSQNLYETIEEVTTSLKQPQSLATANTSSIPHGIFNENEDEIDSIPPIAADESTTKICCK